MSTPEIDEEIRHELDENPALEVVDQQKASDGESDGESDFNETAEQLQLADYRDEDDIPAYRLNAHNFSPDDLTDRFEPQQAAPAESMMDALTAQLAEQHLTDTQMQWARYIVGNIDDNGYLTRSLYQIADDLTMATSTDISADMLRPVYDAVRGLDPAGIAANDLRDCLSLQLHRMDGSDPAVADAVEIIDYYFDLFSLKHYERLMSEASLSRQRLKAATDLIVTLNPKPGRVFDSDSIDSRARHITPDFAVEVGGDTIAVTIPNNIPELAVEASFSADGESAGVRADTKEQAFIRSRRQQATDFIDLLKARQHTLLAVMEAIARVQRKFFTTGDAQTLVPLRLKDISEATGIDISVISRATAGKYVSTPMGMYPLKSLFIESASAISGGDPEATSLSVEKAISDLIAQEDAARPLSDDALTAVLQQRGFDIARRTVAKYRERLGLPVARLRRKI